MKRSRKFKYLVFFANNPTNHQLIDISSMRDDAPFESLYNEYKKLVYNLCLHYLLNTDDAQDATQEVFVKVYQKYSQFNPAYSLIKTWIYRIAINQCLDVLKAKRSKKRVGSMISFFHANSHEPLEQLSNFNHPGIETEDKEALQNLLKIIQSLPENQQTAIILSKIEDRSQKEVAEIMGTSLKAIESLLQRAKLNIQKKLSTSEGF